MEAKGRFALGSVARVLGSVAVLVGVVGPTRADSQQGRADTALSLRAALEMAAARSPRLQAAREAAQSAVSAASAARRRLLPTLEVGAGYLYSPVQERRLIPRARLDGLAVDQIFNTHIGDVSGLLTIPLYQGGELRSRAHAAAAEAEGAAAGAELTEDGLLFLIAAKYYEVLQRDLSVRATEASVANLLETRRIVQQLVEVGRAAPVELFRVNTRLANVQLDLLRERNGVAKALAELETLVGVRLPEGSFVLTDTLAFVPVEVRLDTLVAKALAGRPEIKLAEAAVDRERARVGLAISEHVPHLALVAGLGGAWGDNAPAFQSDAFVSLRVAIPVFKPAVFSEVGAAQARRRAAEQELEQRRLDVALDVERAVLDAEEAAERVEVANASLTEAGEARRIEQLRFEQGRATINDVLDAEAELLRARLGLAAALAGHATAIAAVKRAVGIVSVEELLR